MIKCRMNLGLFSTVLLLILCLRQANGETIKGESVCYRMIKQAVDAEKNSLITARNMLGAQLSQARLKLDLPKTPQVRTRFENTLDQDNPQSRIGLRWYFPKFNSGRDLLSNFRKFSVDKKHLAQQWMTLKKRALFMSKLRNYLKFQALLITQFFYMHQEQLAQAELALNQSLLESGVSTLLKQKTYQKKLSQIGLKKRQIEAKISRFQLKNSWIQYRINSADEAMTLVDCLPTLRPDLLKELFSKSRHESEMKALSIKELELLIKITLQEQKSKLAQHQWLEFFELNYDQSFDSQGLIAEFGINLPIGHQNDAEQLKSSSYVQEFGQLRVSRQQALANIHLNHESFQRLFHQIEAFKALPRAELKSFDEIELNYLKLDLWHLTWLERYELELLFLDYLSLLPSFKKN